MAAVLIAVLCAPRGLVAQEQDPTSAVIMKYSAALNAHDLEAALALFDEFGSATDARGRHFEGREGLTQFLLASGFGDTDTRIWTEGLHVVANRAQWTYDCSCAHEALEARLVVSHDKITVFAMRQAASPPIAPAARADIGVVPWLVGLGLVAGFGVGARGRRRGRVSGVSRRLNQGRLLAALARARAAPRTD